MLPLRARADLHNRWLTERLDRILPELMARENFDLWIVAANEYNEDPVIMSLLPQPAMYARRRTILVFARRADGTVERLSLDRYGHGQYYTAAWEPEKEEQDDCLRRVVAERDPQRIGINVSDNFAFADGLTHNEYLKIQAALGEKYAARMVGAERLAVGWLERRIPGELQVYPGLIELGHAIIAEAFSSRVITPGVTTTDDVVWWMREQMQDLGVWAWFHPTVEIQAHGVPYPAIGKRPEGELRTIIEPGDLLHCDMGFYYLGLASDQQQLAYVLKLGETDAPEGLKAALRAGNRVQDIHLEAMQVGRSGNAALRAILETAAREDIKAMIYTHPIGYHGHAAGPTIGLWDHQEGVPERGDYELFDDTCYSIELNVRAAVPEWDGQEVMIGLEEEAVLTGGQALWLDGRQTSYYLIGG
jgi:hypothetical protein